MRIQSKLSVILPVYNVEPYIRQCLDSIVGQTYRNLEIILVDDGSPDCCGEICDEYAARDDRIIVIHKQNGGVQAARNDGMKIATGEWLTFVDPDDWCELDYYEQLFEAMGDRDVDVFCSGGCYDEFDGKTVTLHGYRKFFLFCNHDEIEGLMAKALAPKYGDESNSMPYGYGTPWDKIYRTSFIKENDLKFDPTLRILDDAWFCFQVFSVAKGVGGCPFIGYHYRFVATSLSKGVDIRKLESITLYIDKVYSYLKTRETKDSTYQAMGVNCIRLFGKSLKLCYFNAANTMPYAKVAKEIKAMKKKPYYHDAIYNKNNRYLTKNLYLLKILLRLPWIWPLKLAYGVRLKLWHI